MSKLIRFRRWTDNYKPRPKPIKEEKTYSRLVTSDQERTQQILTPAQQLEMRKRVSEAGDIDAALAVIDGYIFGDESDGEVDKIITGSRQTDPYALDYSVPYFG